ncbi:hypothetical protein F4780DRAFT_553266 [Xylariomycetidae sp. FL0641]|nr:hypothetical protein F4780DRAFT_553266 [Xylariomycetidae sp. FL0641]
MAGALLMAWQPWVAPGVPGSLRATVTQDQKAETGPLGPLIIFRQWEYRTLEKFSPGSRELPAIRPPSHLHPSPTKPYLINQPITLSRIAHYLTYSCVVVATLTSRVGYNPSSTCQSFCLAPGLCAVPLFAARRPHLHTGVSFLVCKETLVVLGRCWSRCCGAAQALHSLSSTHLANLGFKKSICPPANSSILQPFIARKAVRSTAHSPAADQIHRLTVCSPTDNSAAAAIPSSQSFSCSCTLPPGPSFRQTRVRACKSQARN